MRLRHITGSEDYVAQSEYVVHEPEKNKGQWQQFFGNGHPIHVEIGMGKGQFIEQMALTHPEINYIGIERYDTVMLKALKKREALMAEGAALQNLTFISIDARLLADVFEAGEIDRIYHVSFGLFVAEGPPGEPPSHQPGFHENLSAVLEAGRRPRV